MRSMLTPSAATSRASAPNARAVIGRPSTKMVWVDGSRMIGTSSLRSMVTSRPTARIGGFDVVAQHGAVGDLGRTAQQAPPASGGPRITTCSTLSSSTPWP